MWKMITKPKEEEPQKREKKKMEGGDKTQSHYLHSCHKRSRLSLTDTEQFTYTSIKDIS